MLSICVPVYNYDVRPLVHDLSQQMQALELPAELLCIDDHSAPRFRQQNAALHAMPQVSYEELPQNIGRASIRNLLASRARYEYLLFMDCDSGVVQTDFLQRYLKVLDPQRLVCGGRVYQEVPPVDPGLLLHWRFGSMREAHRAALRNRWPYHAFMTNNFIIPRRLFDVIRFDERIRSYGHEDTLFGLELRRTGTELLHIDNPLLHLGLEPAAVFLQKSETAIDNLLDLLCAGKEIDTRLIRMANQLSRLRLAAPGRWLSMRTRTQMRRQLLSERPSLFLFDLYRLGYFLRKQQEK